MNRTGNRRTHGQSRAPGGQHGTPTYQSWRSMLERCTREKHPAFHRYGGRGITVCKRWRGASGFANFLADMGERPEGTTLDRRHNDRGYEPRNCRWATPTQQIRNSAASAFVSAFGATGNIAEWAECSGLAHGTIRARLDDGWTPEAAVSVPLHAINRWRRDPFFTQLVPEVNARG